MRTLPALSLAALLFAGCAGPGESVVQSPGPALVQRLIPSETVAYTLSFAGSLNGAGPTDRVPCDALGSCASHPFLVQGTRHVNATLALDAPSLPTDNRVQLEIRQAATHATLAAKSGPGGSLNATLGNGTYEFFVQQVAGGPLQYNLTALLDPAIETVNATADRVDRLAVAVSLPTVQVALPGLLGLEAVPWLAGGILAALLILVAAVLRR